MGKHRKPSEKVPALPAKARPEMLPAFGKDALSALTDKIEKELGKSKVSQQLADATERSLRKGKPSKERCGPDSKANPTKAEHNRGTKRDAQGNVKSAGKVEVKSSRRKEGHKFGAAKNPRERLLKEILAMGGTEEDLDLVAGAASDYEDVGGNNGLAKDKSFKEDLARFVAGLGIEGAAIEDASEPEAEVDEDGAKSEVSDEGSEDVLQPEKFDAPDELKDASQKLVAAVSEVKKPNASMKGSNNLVSTLPIRPF